MPPQRYRIGYTGGYHPWTSSNTAVATVNNAGVVTGVNAGTAVITYTNNNGCSVTATVTVNPQPAISGNLTVCLAEQAPSRDPVPAAANPGPAPDPSMPRSAMRACNRVNAGTITITYTNSNGCSITASFIVNALPTISGTLSVCKGSTTSLTGSGTPAAVNPDFFQHNRSHGKQYRPGNRCQCRHRRYQLHNNGCIATVVTRRDQHDQWCSVCANQLPYVWNGTIIQPAAIPAPSPMRHWLRLGAT